MMDSPQESVSIIGSLNEKIQELQQENEKLRKSFVSPDSFLEAETMAKEEILPSGSPYRESSFNISNNAIQSIQLKLDEAQQEIINLNSQLETALQDNKVKTEALEQANSQIQQFLHSAANASSQSYENSKNFEEIMKENQLLRQQFKASIATNDRLFLSNTDLSNQLYSLKIEAHKNLKNDENTLIELQTVISTLSSIFNVSSPYDLVPAARSLSSTAQEVSSLHQQLTLAQKKIDDNEQYIKQLEENPKIIEISSSADKLQIIELENEVKLLKSQLSSENEKSQKNEIKIQEITSKNLQLQQSFNDAESQIIELKNSLDITEKQILQIQKEKLELQQLQQTQQLQQAQQLQQISNEKQNDSLSKLSEKLDQSVQDDSYRTNNEIIEYTMKALVELRNLPNATSISNGIQDLLTLLLFKDESLSMDFDKVISDLIKDLNEHFMTTQICDLLLHLQDEYDEFGSKFLEKMDELGRKQNSLQIKLNGLQRIMKKKSNNDSNSNKEKRHGFSRIPQPRKSIGPENHPFPNVEPSKTPIKAFKGPVTIFT